MNEKRCKEIGDLVTAAHKAKYPSRYSEPYASASDPEEIDPIFDKLIEAIRLCAPNPFSDAREEMASHFQDKRDGAVYQTYHANIAMKLYDYSRNPGILLLDSQGGLHIDFCNRMASLLMEMIFEQ